MLEYGGRQGAVRRIIGLMWMSAGILEYLQHFFAKIRMLRLGDFTLIGRLTAAFLAHGPWKGACLGIA